MTKLLRKREVAERVGLHPVHIMRLANAGKFPQPVVISENAVGFVEAEVEAYIANRIKARDDGTAKRPKGPQAREAASP